MASDGLLEQNSAFTDMQFFYGPDEIRATSGTATLTLNASGDMSLNIGNTQTVVAVISLSEILRTGRYASSAVDQQQFGTAAALPGPSAVANTSGPLALKAGYPPILAAQMATMGSVQIGPVAKGIQINSLDFIYLVTGAALTTNQVGLTKTVFANNVANAVTNMVAKAANGMQTATQANPYVTNVPVAAPAFLVTSDTETIVEWDVTTGGAGTARLYGVVARCSFNFN